ncbi:MAG TPA: phosphate ABC transporter substrate-binding/OmpA family protein [Myxococcales bacterium]|nr:phosphate ABC transporter substrate-binding/OmpA family protein [Myxococcales bacterium]
MRLSGRLVPLASVAGHLPKAIAAVVDKSLAREPEERYATAREMREALAAALAESGVRAATREEVGKLVSDLFVREREELQAKIRDSINATEHDTVADQTPPLPDLHDSALQTPSGSMQTKEIAAPPPKRKLSPRAGLTVAVALAAAAAAGLWTARRGLGQPALRFCGSNAVGSSLAPALVAAFRQQRGTPALPVSIEAQGSATAFTGFAEARCDLGMASRQMSDQERSTIGELRTPATEHVVALDGIAVVVHPANRLGSLTVAQLRSIFSGEVNDWSQVGGAAGPIRVYARDDRSGTYDTFQHLVLGKSLLASGAQRFADSAQLSDRVASDPAAIGFIGFPYVRSAKALAVAAGGARPLLPSPFTVADESYPLSRRLYLYTLPSPRTPLVNEFVQFALSEAGQRVVRENGFVDLSIAARAPEPCGPDCPPAYVSATRGAKRLTVDFRFQPGSGELDSRGARDVERLVSWLSAGPPSRVLLLGFADANGDSGKASLDEAQQVATELERRGVRAQLVAGFGSSMPVSAANDAGAWQRNRRVEVWTRDAL